MGANAFPGIGNVSHDGLLFDAAYAEDGFQSFEEHLQNVVAFPGGVFNKLIQGSNDDATNDEPFHGAHNHKAKILQA
jgi:hypothetical protein